MRLHDVSRGLAPCAQISHEPERRRYVAAPDSLLSKEARPDPMHVARLSKLIAALPMVERNDGTVTAEWFGGSYQGLETLAELWECKPKAAALTLRRLRDSGIAVNTEYRSHRHRLTLEYAATTGAQMPTALASINAAPTVHGHAITLYLVCSVGSALNQPLTVAEQSKATGLDPRRTEAARAALRAAEMLGSSGRIVRISRKSVPTRSGGDQPTRSGGFRSRDTRSDTPSVDSGSLPPSGSTEDQGGGEIQNQPTKTPPKRPARQTRRALTELLTDAGPAIESRATGRALTLIADQLASGTTTEELTHRYGGNLAKTLDPVGVIAHRIATDTRQRVGDPAMKAHNEDERAPVIHVQPLSAERQAEILDDAELAAIERSSSPPEHADRAKNLAGIAAIRSKLDRGGRL